MIRYQVIKTVPFNMLEMLMAHHAPFNPKAVGIESGLWVSSVHLGYTHYRRGTFFPRPLNAPAVVASIHLAAEKVLLSKIDYPDTIVLSFIESRIRVAKTLKGQSLLARLWT